MPEIPCRKQSRRIAGRRFLCCRRQPINSGKVVSDPNPTSTTIPAAAASVLVSDFDGTMTRHDFFELVRRRWPGPPADDPWEQYVAGRLTHFQALARIFAAIPAAGTDLLKLVTQMELDADLPDAVGRLRAGGWEIVVASAGCEWYIRHLLRAARVDLSVHANPGRWVEGQGLQMSPPMDSPYFRAETGIDKVAVVRAALARGIPVAFAGDGRPDWAAALLVSPARRFARGWLAEELTRHGESFHPFTRWSQIAEKLLPC